MKKLYILLLFVITTVVSCTSDEPASRVQSTDGSLIGTWIIQSSVEGNDSIVYNDTPCPNTVLEFRTDYQLITYLYRGNDCHLITSYDDYTLSDDDIIGVDNERYLIYELTNTTLKLKHLSGRIDTYSRE